jgi:dephospho-CoA kinase
MAATTNPRNDITPVIGLVGGVGSGKSALARSLDARDDVVVINGDKVGHQVLTIPSVIQDIRHKFGESVLTPQGDIDRTVLGRLVFGADSVRKEARESLQAIVHPKIRDRFRELIDLARASTTTRIVILDAAVLLESGWQSLCDFVVFIDVPVEQRLSRIETRGWNSKELNSREASQWPIEKKRDTANFIVDNSGDLADAGQALEQIIDNLPLDPDSLR